MVVPNGTILSPQVVKYVERYRGLAKQTAEAIIKLAVTLVEAEKELNGVDFKLFCEEVNVPKSGSVYKKLTKIGNEATRFTPFLDKLPNTWTTIYELAKLPSDKFDLVAPGLNPFITAKQIGERAGTKEKHSDPKATAKPADFKISVGFMKPEEKSALYEMIYKLRAEYHFEVETDKTLEEEVFNLKKQAKAA
jgi:hypothetical protein